MTTQLLVSAGVICDIAFFVFIALGILLGVCRGFVKCICKLAGTLFALAFALAFCISFCNFLESTFGMTTAIAKGLSGCFSDEAYTTALGAGITGETLSSALEDVGVGGFWRWVIGLGFSKTALIPSGTTAATLAGSVLAKWISVAIAFVALVLLIKIGAMILGKLLTAVVEKVPGLKPVNKILGGLFQGAVTVLIIIIGLAICSWIPSETLHEALSEGTVVAAIYNSEWFAQATSFLISGQWLSGLMAG